MAINQEKKSNRLLGNRRFTSADLTTAQEAFTEVLDINSNEIYTQTFGGDMDDRALGGDKGSNGEPLIIGYTSSFGNGSEDILFIKIDPNYQP